MLGISRLVQGNFPSLIKYPRINWISVKKLTCNRYKDMDLKRMEHNFWKANRDVYNKLNMNEFNYYIGLTIGRKMDDVDLRELFGVMDTNKDLYIGKGEVTHHLEKGLCEQTRGNLSYAFCRFDKDQDDFMYLHEFREALFYLGFYHAGDHRIAKFFAQKDTDRDYRITYDQFTKIIKEDLPQIIA